MKKIQPTNPPLFSAQAACAEDAVRLRELLSALMGRIRLSDKHTAMMRRDFTYAIGRYLEQGLDVSEIERRLSPEKLGYFYYEDPEEWYSLDTAATIYPLSMRRGWMPIFRLSAYLKEDVSPEFLQLALTFTIRRFPYYSVTLGRGFFWDYMDSTRRHFTVKEESRKPFSIMNLSRFRAPCFRVIYYKNRISAEFFHILTDGTGGIRFLKTLLSEYFRLLGHEVPCECGIFDLSETPSPAEWANDFPLADPAPASAFSGKRAVQLKGTLSHQRPHQILHFEFDSDKLRAIAKEKGATFTALLLTFFFFACKAASVTSRKSVQIQVPCNMRKYYPSHTMRNFAMYCILCMHPSEICDFDTVLARVSEELARGTSREELTKQMVAGVNLVNSLKLVPMFFKTPLVRWFYPLFSDHILTTTLSNLGVVQLPSEIEHLVDKFDFVLGTTVSNRATCSLITYQNKAVLSIFKATDHPAFEEALLSQFKKHGITPTVTGSEAYGFHRCIPED